MQYGVAKLQNGVQASMHAFTDIFLMLGKRHVGVPQSHKPKQQDHKSHDEKDEHIKNHILQQQREDRYLYPFKKFPHLLLSPYIPLLTDRPALRIVS